MSFITWLLGPREDEECITFTCSVCKCEIKLENAQKIKVETYLWDEYTCYKRNREYTDYRCKRDRAPTLKTKIKRIEYYKYFRDPVKVEWVEWVAPKEGYWKKLEGWDK